MHYKIASEKSVPFIGDIMTSRWAYESLMVTQFKDNRFETHFFDSEKDIHNAIYYKSYVIPQLQNIIVDCDRLKNISSDTVKISQELAILSNELVKICNEINMAIPKVQPDLIVARYNKNIGASVNIVLKQIEDQFIYRYNNAINIRDWKYAYFSKKLGGDEAFLKFKYEYYNKQIASVVTDENEIMDYVIQNNEFVRIKDAIFRTPVYNNGRAHFYSPVKRVMGLIIDTFWFNLFVIWIFSSFLFIILYYDILRKIIEYFETIRLNRLTRRRFLGVI